MKKLMIICLLSLSLACGLPVISGLFPSSPTKQEEKYVILRPIKVNNQWGYINETGKVIVEPQYFYANEYSEGLGAVRVELGDRVLYGFLDETGKMSIPPQFGAVSEFSDGLAAVRTDNGWGYINKTGVLGIEDKYTAAMDFSDGVAGVSINNFPNPSFFGYIDSSGNTAFEFDLEFFDKHEFPGFSEGLAPIVEEKKCFYIDKKGEIQLEVRIDQECLGAGSFLDGIASVTIKDAISGVRKGGFINNKGKVIIPTIYSQFNDFSEGLTAAGFGVEHDFKYGYIDVEGKVVIKPQFYNAFSFSEGLAAVQLVKDGDFGFIDNSGKVVIEPKYGIPDGIYGGFYGGLAKVPCNDKYCYINKYGDIVWELEE